MHGLHQQEFSRRDSPTALILLAYSMRKTLMSSGVMVLDITRWGLRFLYSMDDVISDVISDINNVI